MSKEKKKMWHETNRFEKDTREYINEIYPGYKLVKYDINHHPEAVFDSEGQIESFILPTDKQKTITIVIHTP